MKTFLLLALLACVFLVAFAQDAETQAVAAAPVVKPAVLKADQLPEAVKKINEKYKPTFSQLNAAWKKEFEAKKIARVRTINVEIRKLKAATKKHRAEIKKIRASFKKMKTSNAKFLALERQSLKIQDNTKRKEFVKNIEKQRRSSIAQRKKAKASLKTLANKINYNNKLIVSLRSQRRDAYKAAVAFVKAQNASYKKKIADQYKTLFSITASLKKATDAKNQNLITSLSSKLAAAKEALIALKAKKNAVANAITFFKNEKKRQAENKAKRAAKRKAAKLARNQKLAALKTQLAQTKDKKAAKKLQKKIATIEKKIKKTRIGSLRRSIRNIRININKYKKLLANAQKTKNAAVEAAAQKSLAALRQKRITVKAQLKQLRPAKCLRVGGKKQCGLSQKALATGKFFCKRSFFRSVCFQCGATKTVNLKVNSKTSTLTVTKKTGACTKAITYVPDNAVKAVKEAAFAQLKLDATVAPLLKTTLLNVLIKKNATVRSRYHTILRSLLSQANNKALLRANPLKLKEVKYAPATKVYSVKLSAAVMAKINKDKKNKFALKAAVSKILANLKKRAANVKVIVPKTKPVNYIRKPFRVRDLVKNANKKKVVKKPAKKVVKKVVKKAAKKAAKKVIKKIVKKAVKKGAKKSVKVTKKNGVTTVTKVYKYKSCKKNCGPKVVTMKIVLGRVKCPKKKAAAKK